MTTGVIAVGPETPFREVATMLFAGAVRAVPVLDEERRLLGVVSEADLLLTAEHRDPAAHRPRHTGRPGPGMKAGAATARELMTAPAVTTDPATTVAGAARTLDGQLGTRTDAVLAARFVERVEGVVRVVDRLRWQADAHDADLDVAPLHREVPTG